jgi:hypothetical protein
MANPCAFILVRFADDPSTPISVNEAKTLFTVQGRGRLYLVDYFDEITHGRVDMSGNAVFGWYDLSWTRQDYLDQRARTGDRTVLVAEASRVARNNGAPIDSFVATIVASNGPGPAADFYGGYWSGQGHVQTTADQGPGNVGRESKVSPAALCQEIVHALGVPQHARRTGSDADYQDPFDVMSLWTNGTSAPHPENPDYVIGPGINAAFLDRCGWLDQSRGVTITHSGSYQLRPLHRRDLPGNLFARLGDQYIEYRPKLRWDAGQAESVVLVHHRANLTSYLDEVRVPEAPPRDPPFQIFGLPAQMWVSSIDDDALTATVEVRVPRQEPVAGPAVSLFGTDADGGGLVLIGGKLHRIPPRSPSYALLERVVALEETFIMGVTPALQLQVQQQILTELAATVTAQLDDTKVPRPERSAER